jgi:hypothetical protein
LSDNKVRVIVRKAKDSSIYEYIPKQVVDTSINIGFEMVIDHYALDDKGARMPVYRKEYFWKSVNMESS